MTLVRRYPIRSRGRRRLHRGANAGLLIAGALVLTVAGCSGSDGSPAPPGGSSSSSAGPAPGATGGPAASAGAAAPALAVLASRDAMAKDVPIRVDLNELRVEGRVTRLTFTVRNRTPVPPAGEPVQHWQIASFFTDGIYQKKSGTSADDAFSVDGVYLLDGAGAKRYLAARNANQGCVCSGDLSNTFVNPGSGVVLTTLFAALPSEVSSVDVVVPGFGPFTAVPVSR